ncbi:hypothetical protein GPECTOR_743g905 [Gonium pectorale]|uniref:Uncharacterized protein n=1 Tax=Gonium pectorale TaxID=33097 RepID=A0A150FU43_GONPE|nr:hypothetical protein GPECTOR_743g905 [Gonium pectorale]|eukprot:KXZ41134.1 hypothetical protein GPECTOR_743g905 [Gonium pectorale]
MSRPIPSASSYCKTGVGDAAEDGARQGAEEPSLRLCGSPPGGHCHGQCDGCEHDERDGACDGATASSGCDGARGNHQPPQYGNYSMSSYYHPYQVSSSALELELNSGGVATGSSVPTGFGAAAASGGCGSGCTQTQITMSSDGAKVLTDGPGAASAAAGGGGVGGATFVCRGEASEEGGSGVVVSLMDNVGPSEQALDEILPQRLPPRGLPSEAAGGDGGGGGGGGGSMNAAALRHCTATESAAQRGRRLLLRGLRIRAGIATGPVSWSVADHSHDIAYSGKPVRAALRLAADSAASGRVLCCAVTCAEAVAAQAAEAAEMAAAAEAEPPPSAFSAYGHRFPLRSDPPAGWGLAGRSGMLPTPTGTATGLLTPGAGTGTGMNAGTGTGMDGSRVSPRDDVGGTAAAPSALRAAGRALVLAFAPLEAGIRRRKSAVFVCGLYRAEEVEPAPRRAAAATLAGWADACRTQLSSARTQADSRPTSSLLPRLSVFAAPAHGGRWGAASPGVGPIALMLQQRASCASGPLLTVEEVPSAAPPPVAAPLSYARLPAASGHVGGRLTTPRSPISPSIFARAVSLLASSHGAVSGGTTAERASLGTRPSPDSLGMSVGGEAGGGSNSGGAGGGFAPTGASMSAGGGLLPRGSLWRIGAQLTGHITPPSIVAVHGSREGSLASMPYSRPGSGPTPTIAEAPPAAAGSSATAPLPALLRLPLLPSPVAVLVPSALHPTPRGSSRLSGRTPLLAGRGGGAGGNGGTAGVPVSVSGVARPFRGPVTPPSGILSTAGPPGGRRMRADAGSGPGLSSRAAAQQPRLLQAAPPLAQALSPFEPALGQLPSAEYTTMARSHGPWAALRQVATPDQAGKTLEGTGAASAGGAALTAAGLGWCEERSGSGAAAPRQAHAAGPAAPLGAPPGGLTGGSWPVEPADVAPLPVLPAVPMGSQGWLLPGLPQLLVIGEVLPEEQGEDNEAEAAECVQDSGAGLGGLSDAGGVSGPGEGDVRGVAESRQRLCGFEDAVLGTGAQCSEAASPDAHIRRHSTPTTEDTGSDGSSGDAETTTARM